MSSRPADPMEALAPWAGMSASNIRKGKAYNDNDIHAVAGILGRFPPGEPADPEFAAMAHLDRILDGQVPAARAAILAVPDRLRAENLAKYSLDDAAWNRILTWARAKYGPSESSTT